MTSFTDDLFLGQLSRRRRQPNGQHRQKAQRQAERFHLRFSPKNPPTDSVIPKEQGMTCHSEKPRLWRRRRICGQETYPRCLSDAAASHSSFLAEFILNEILQPSRHIGTPSE